MNNRRLPENADHRRVRLAVAQPDCAARRRAVPGRSEDTGVPLCALLNQLQSHTDALYELARAATDRLANHTDNPDPMLPM